MAKDVVILLPLCRCGHPCRNNQPFKTISPSLCRSAFCHSILWMAAMNQAESMTNLLLKPAGKQLLLLVDKKSRMKSWIVQTLLKVFIHSTTYQRRQVGRNRIILRTTGQIYPLCVCVCEKNTTAHLPNWQRPASCNLLVGSLGFGGEQSENPWPTGMGGLSLRSLLENLGTKALL